jgi:hypothetical protein
MLSKQRKSVYILPEALCTINSKTKTASKLDGKNIIYLPNRRNFGILVF